MAVMSNGSVAWAQQTADAGFVALVLATVPLWMAVIDRISGASASTRTESVGLAVGFAGLSLLIGPSAASGAQLPEIALCLVASIGWATGSVYSRRAVDPLRPLTSTALWMIVGGTLLALIAAARGELRPEVFGAISPGSAAAVGYLIVFGTLLGFSIYIWLLRVGRTSVVSTYAYVNPLVAVVLAAAFLGEDVTWEMWCGGGLVLVSVAMVLTGSRSAAPSGAPVTEV